MPPLWGSCQILSCGFFYPKGGGPPNQEVIFRGKIDFWVKKDICKVIFESFPYGQKCMTSDGLPLRVIVIWGQITITINLTVLLASLGRGDWVVVAVVHIPAKVVDAAGRQNHRGGGLRSGNEALKQNITCNRSTPQQGQSPKWEWCWLWRNTSPKQGVLLSN